MVDQQMYFEIHRLADEDKLEGFMATETLKCSKCERTISFTADEGEEKRVKCKCGHEMIVVIEKQAA